MASQTTEAVPPSTIEPPPHPAPPVVAMHEGETHPTVFPDHEHDVFYVNANTKLRSRIQVIGEKVGKFNENTFRTWRQTFLIQIKAL